MKLQYLALFSGVGAVLWFVSPFLSGLVWGLGCGIHFTFWAIAEVLKNGDELEYVPKKRKKAA